ncbi:hypothetical protein HLB35_05430 [Halomonas sp. TBZ9]|uniref:Uncharacterized protein n=1 Tax=Vreelandella azerica TaxID=2732867 RepID=A0A7Y3TX38_9GAMM|nr:hypothetical protein [Halomonas azerica]NOG31345.1 hypothetical protein [Halomonas azerica]
MKLYCSRTLSWQVVLGFTLLGGICALAAMLYIFQARQPNSDVSHRERLALGFMVENDLAKAYSELSDLVHSEAGEQRIIMERLALTVASLIFVVLLLVVGLSLALRKLNREHQKSHNSAK